MTTEVTTNKQGQALGAKGTATRRRLMEAARRLLKTQSPMQLTAVAIAKEAKTSSATFYMYFDDVKDIMYALSEAAGKEIGEVYAALDEPWDASKVEVDRARLFVEAIFSFWARHREILRYRNLEADRGDTRFEDLRVRYYSPIVEMIGNRILAAYPPGSRPRRGDALAEASVIHAALESIAATDPNVMERALGVARIQDALARVIAHVLGGRAEDDTWYPKARAARAEGSRSKVVARKREAEKVAG